VEDVDWKLPTQHQKTRHFRPRAVGDEERVVFNIERWCLVELTAPLPYGAHVPKVLVELARDHAQYTWKLTVADFIFKIRDDDAAKVAAHDTDCLAPIRRSNAGWSSLIIMRPAKARSIRSESDCSGHLGSGKASGSRATCTKYPSIHSSPRLVA